MSEQKSSDRLVEISVGRLVDFACRRGDLRSDGPLVPSFHAGHGPAEAIRLHQKVQKARKTEDPDYEAEVAIAGVVQSLRPVRLVGRLDGVHPSKAPPVIEEIKTTRRALPTLSAGEAMHWAQLETYGYLWADERALDEVTLRLTYVHLDHGERIERERTVGFEELHGIVSRAVDKLARWFDRLEQWQRRRDASIRDMSFPHRRFRPGQRELAVSVYQAARDGMQLFVEAPTGSGKTAASLFPSLKALGEGHRSSIAYLTARSTGKRAAEAMLETFVAGGLEATALTLTAREEICFNPDKTCNGEECSFARGFYDRVDAARQGLFSERVLDRSRVEALAREHELCPFELSVELSSWVDVVICDYNYAFHPHRYLRRLFGEGQDVFRTDRSALWIIDEAHQLVDRGREMYSASLRARPFRRIAGSLGSEARVVRQRASAIARVLESLDATPSGLPEADAGWWQPLLLALRRFLDAASRWQQARVDARPMDAETRSTLLSCCLDAIHFLRAAEFEEPATIPVADPQQHSVKLFCVDPSAGLRERFTRSDAAMLCSATLKPLAYFERCLGTDEDCRWSVAQSPFPPENLCTLVADSVGTTYRERESTLPEVVAHLSAMVRARRGNYLLFFPSFAYLRLAAEALRTSEPGLDVRCQEPGMTEPMKQAFLDALEPGTETTLAAFAVMGGVFGESVDLPGNAIDGAAIVSVGLPGVGPERDAVREHYEAECGAGFEYAYAYPGLQRVLQAAGRVIRTEEDRGALLLIGRRFRRYPYRELLPKHWNLTATRSADETQQRLASFWSVSGAPTKEPS